MNWARPFSQSKSLVEYGNAGFLLLAPFAMALAFFLESRTQSAPGLRHFLDLARETLKAFALHNCPPLAPLAPGIVSLPALVALALVVVSMRPTWRNAAGVVFADVALGVSSFLLGIGEFFIHRRTVALAFLLFLTAAIPLGFEYRRHQTLAQDTLQEECDAFERDLFNFVDSTALTRDETEQAHRLVERWEGAPALARVASGETPGVVALIKDLYAPLSPEEWNEQVRQVSGQPIAPDAADDAPGTTKMAAARRLLLGRAHLRVAMVDDCGPTEDIDAAATLFKSATQLFPRSSHAGLAAAYRCAFDHMCSATSVPLQSCGDVLDCARHALDALSVNQPRIEGCDYLELKRRNNLVDLLTRVGKVYGSFPKLAKLPRASTSSTLARYIADESTNLRGCRDLSRLQDSMAFATLAEANAVIFGLQRSRGADDSYVKDAAGDAARWLLVASLLSPGNDRADLSLFCPIAADSATSQVFNTIAPQDLIRPQCK
jgi:hypothetical protein